MYPVATPPRCPGNPLFLDKGGAFRRSIEEAPHFSCRLVDAANHAFPGDPDILNGPHGALPHRKKRVLSTVVRIAAQRPRPARTHGGKRLFGSSALVKGVEPVSRSQTTCRFNAKDVLVEHRIRDTASLLGAPSHTRSRYVRPGPKESIPDGSEGVAATGIPPVAAGRRRLAATADQSPCAGDT